MEATKDVVLKNPNEKFVYTVLEVAQTSIADLWSTVIVLLVQKSNIY